MAKTPKDKVMDLLKGMDKHVDLSVDKQKWETQPNGGGLDHVLKLTISMNDEERAEIEDLFRNFWEIKCTLIGTEKPKQAELDFDSETVVEPDEN